MSYYRQGPFRPPGSGMTIGVPGLTPYVKAIMIACGVVWFAQVLLGQAGIRLAPYLGVVPAAVAHGAVWQLVTYMFLHDPQHLMHIVFNMLMLWMFGGDLERHWGSRAFLRFYFVCGIGGGVFIALMGLIAGGFSAVVPTIGASGAIFGVIMAYGMVFSERTVLFMLIFPMRARTMAIILFGLTFFYTFASRGGTISHVGHLGGAVVGFLYLKRAWRVGELYRELRWRLRRRRFRVMHRDDPDDFDRWVN